MSGVRSPNRPVPPGWMGVRRSTGWVMPVPCVRPRYESRRRARIGGPGLLALLLMLLVVLWLVGR
jgi:hypothetical protein